MADRERQRGNVGKRERERECEAGFKVHQFNNANMQQVALTLALKFT